MKWLEISIFTRPEAEEITSAVLLEAGAQGVSIKGASFEETAPWDYLDPDVQQNGQPFCVSAWFAEDAGPRALEEVRQRVESIRHMGLDIPLGSLDVTAQMADESDWANAWKAYFKPMAVSERVVICPSWETYAPAADELVISLDPGMAFGTGSHETTRMCVRLLEEYVQEGATVVDAGCGSGVLSIAAALLGAGRVYALDFDPVAVTVAGENVELNQCGAVVDVTHSDLLAALDGDLKADIVVANIIADVVIRLAGEAHNHLKHNGMFLCSGIIDTRLEDVKRALEQNGFRVIEILEDGEWCAVAAKYKV